MRQTITEGLLMEPLLTISQEAVQQATQDQTPVADISSIIRAASGFVTNPIGSIVGGAVDFLGGVFGGPKEDTSLTGFQTFLSQNARQAWTFPTAQELIGIGQASGWPGDIINAIRGTYNQADGSFNHGDWHCVVSNLAPVTVDLFKGAKEHNQLKSSSNYVFMPQKSAPAPAVVSSSGQINTATDRSNTVAVPGQSQQSANNVTDQILNLIKQANQSAQNLIGVPLVPSNMLPAIQTTMANNPNNNSQGNQAPGSGSFSFASIPWFVWPLALLVLFLIMKKKSS